ncbi:hypothetical protein TNCV_2163271 [Trichonephila clavipes]|nr:hypothetical protein TNCV_2163271 [Trichonephila clavipes]
MASDLTRRCRETLSYIYKKHILTGGEHSVPPGEGRKHYTCIAPNCNNNYKDTGTVQMFGFPKGDFLRKNGYKLFQKKDFAPSKYSKICELHFLDNAIRRYTEAYNEKTGEKICVPLKRYRLLQLPDEEKNQRHSPSWRARVRSRRLYAPYYFPHCTPGLNRNQSGVPIALFRA